MFCNRFKPKITFFFLKSEKKKLKPFLFGLFLSNSYFLSFFKNKFLLENWNPVHHVRPLAQPGQGSHWQTTARDGSPGAIKYEKTPYFSSFPIIVRPKKCIICTILPFSGYENCWNWINSIKTSKSQFWYSMVKILVNQSGDNRKKTLHLAISKRGI